MQPIEVVKKKLLETLTDNRAKHEAEYRAAMDGFRERLAVELKKKLVRIENGDDVDALISMPATKPQSHLDDYDRAIAMLGWEVAETVKLEETEFQNLVQDDWPWRQTFSSSSSSYGPSRSSSSSSSR